MRKYSFSFLKLAVFKGLNTQTSHPATFCHRESEWPCICVALCCQHTWQIWRWEACWGEIALVGKPGGLGSCGEKADDGELTKLMSALGLVLALPTVYVQLPSFVKIPVKSRGITSPPSRAVNTLHCKYAPAEIKQILLWCWRRDITPLW